jgi:hypothetical protein
MIYRECQGDGNLGMNWMLESRGKSRCSELPE